MYSCCLLLLRLLMLLVMVVGGYQSTWGALRVRLVVLVLGWSPVLLVRVRWRQVLTTEPPVIAAVLMLSVRRGLEVGAC